jgi:hypothetical protein
MSQDKVQDFLKSPRSYLEACATAYSQVRYLRHVHDDLLNNRADDIAGNFWTTDAAGAVAKLTDAVRCEFFYRLHIELEEERRIRSAGTVIDFDEPRVRATASAIYTPTRLASATPTLANDGFVRFGKFAHLESALTPGRFRIAPASGYNDPSLNAAQVDNELQHMAITPNEHMAFKIYGKKTLNGPEEEIPVQRLQLFRYMDVPPFYVLCLSSRFDFRMFHDFEADAALVIHSPSKATRWALIGMLRMAAYFFLNRLMTSMASVGRATPAICSALRKLLTASSNSLREIASSTGTS